ncbi:cytochrome c family protein, partial [Xanthobacter autotrophicus DSM 431]
KVWDLATLDDYIENPKHLAPKGKMAFAGIKSGDDRKDLIAYLATFGADGKPAAK